MLSLLLLLSNNLVAPVVISGLVYSQILFTMCNMEEYIPKGGRFACVALIEPNQL
jgi:hypothetical protein